MEVKLDKQYPLDVDAARAAMRTHLGNSRERLRKSQLQPGERQN